jgi:hypothetical protein
MQLAFPPIDRHHQSGGKDIMLNRDLILYAERSRDGKSTIVTLVGEIEVTIQEELHLLQDKSH